MTRFTITPTPLEGVKRIQRQRLNDARGFFSRLFCAEELAEAGFHEPVAQINHSLTRQQGTIRGMHFQRGVHGEDKFVSCLQGAIFDVAVDLRRGSATFLKWHGEVLSSDNARGLLIPRGFAHGFQTLSDACELVYFHSRPYCAEAEGALNAMDPALAIAWPLPPTDISSRDASHPFLEFDFEGI